MDCVFCKIVEGSLPSHKIDEDEHVLAFLDINPATAGHTLVVLKRHASDLWELSEEEALQVTSMVHRTASKLRDRLESRGLNVMQSNGVAAWQTVFHYHVHLVPRYPGDSLRLPWIPTAGSEADLVATWELLK